MAQTKIDWCDYTINPVKGVCPMPCSYCYARRMYKRFKWNPMIRYDDWVWHEGPKIPPGSRVFVGSTIELFGPWIEPDWLKLIFEYCESVPSTTFIFLTKIPDALPKWSPFPENCWVGVTVCSDGDATLAYYGLSQTESNIRFISCEPLLGAITMKSHRILEVVDWVIIGAQTPYSPKTAPREVWVREITDAAVRAGIPIFHKDNLGMIFNADGFPKRQEIPTKIASGKTRP